MFVESEVNPLSLKNTEKMGSGIEFIAKNSEIKGFEGHKPRAPSPLKFSMLKSLSTNKNELDDPSLFPILTLSEHIMPITIPSLN